MFVTRWADQLPAWSALDDQRKQRRPFSFSDRVVVVNELVTREALSTE